jgi:tRNA G26 N,N-dimethylase Trm1
MHARFTNQRLAESSHDWRLKSIGRNPENRIEVFKTNVMRQKQAKTILNKLKKQFNDFKINFDLSDCDKVLRVQGISISPEKIIDLMKANGYQCEVLV